MNRPIATASPRSVHAVNSFFHVLADAGRARRARTRARTEARPADLSARPPDAGGPPRCTVVPARRRFAGTRIAHTAPPRTRAVHVGEDTRTRAPHGAPRWPVGAVRIARRRRVVRTGNRIP